MERDYVIKLGTILFTMVEPTKGHEVEYNGWYERSRAFWRCVRKLQGLQSPFAGTDLHSMQQTRGVTTVVVTGVSLNVGIPGTVIEAVNHGYRVVLARDCVVGLPTEYGEAIIANTIKTIATLASSADLVAVWSG